MKIIVVQNFSLMAKEKFLISYWTNFSGKHFSVRFNQKKNFGTDIFINSLWKKNFNSKISIEKPKKISKYRNVSKNLLLVQKIFKNFFGKKKF